jgi:hypothetical protein
MVQNILNDAFDIETCNILDELVVLDLCHASKIFKVKKQLVTLKPIELVGLFNEVKELLQFVCFLLLYQILYLKVGLIELLNHYLEDLALVHYRPEGSMYFLNDRVINHLVKFVGYFLLLVRLKVH